MAFDIEMIEKVYAGLAAKIAAARKVVGRPMTLTEKKYYTHTLAIPFPLKLFSEVYPMSILIRIE